MNSSILLLISLLLSLFFTGIEVAFIAASKLKIEVEKTKNLMSAKLLSPLVNNQKRFISILWLGNIVSLVIYGFSFHQLFLQSDFNTITLSNTPPGIVYTIELLIASLIFLLVAEVSPRLIFQINANNTLKFFAIPLYLIYKIINPVIVVFIGISEFLLSTILRIKITSREYTFNSIDLDKIISDSAIPIKEEDEDYQEIQMFQNARDLSKIKLRDCMVPRNEIIAMELEESISNLVSLIIESGHSKILVYDKSIDNIIGYSHSYDIFTKPEKINDIIKPVIIVPETMTADKLLNTFIIERKSVALVVDEFGGTAGMLTIEDIIEKIFGEIEDEYDVEEIEDIQINEHEFVVSGRLEIDYINQKYKLNLPESDDYTTLAGFIININNSIPVQGEKIVFKNMSFTITQATESRIDKVLIENAL